MCTICITLTLQIGFYTENHCYMLFNNSERMSAQLFNNTYIRFCGGGNEWKVITRGVNS